MRFAIGLLLVVIVVAVAVYYPRSSAGRQAANMRLAEQHARALAPQLQADPRFARVKVFAHSDRGGALGVSGAVVSVTDFSALQAIVAASAPPVPVIYAIGIDDKSSSTNPASSLGAVHPSQP